MCDAPRELQWAQESKLPTPPPLRSGLSLLRLSGFLVAGCLDNDAKETLTTQLREELFATLPQGTLPNSATAL